MLQLRPNCEACDKDLPADSTEACICSYECTFCRACVDSILKNVCPNCGGGFVSRPVRPHLEHRPGVSLQQNPASTDRVLSQYKTDEIQQFSETIKHLKPEHR